MTICDKVQRQLAEAGVAAAEAEDIARHLEGCADCSKFLADLRTIDAGLIEMTSHDAPDDVVTETLAAVRAAGRPDAVRARPGQRQRWLAGGLAGGAVIAASVALTINLYEPAFRDSAVVAQNPSSKAAPGADDDGGLYRFFGLSDQPVATTAPGAEQVLSESETTVANAPAQVRAAEPQGVGDYRARGDRSEVFANERQTFERLNGDLTQSKDANVSAESARELDVIAQIAPEDLIQRGLSSRGRQAGAAGNRDRFYAEQGAGAEVEPNASAAAAPAPIPSAPVGGKAKFDDKAVREGEAAQQRLRMPPEKEESAGAAASQLEALNKQGQEPVSSEETSVRLKGQSRASVGAGEDAGRETVREVPEEQPTALVDISADEKKNRANLRVEDAGRHKNIDRAIGGSFAEGTTSHAPNALAVRLIPNTRDNAIRFLRAHRSLDGLSFQQSTGYWANTYIPGDAQIRLLEARLAAWDRSALGEFGRLEQDVRSAIQPFDAPTNEAVAVTMASDVTAIDGPARLRVQIGLKAAERLGGRRPAMNIGLVVDAREIADAEMGARIRALVTALDRARQSGDRFSLTVAGPGGGLLVPPEDFRHGTLQVAFQRIIGADGSAGEALSLPAAMVLASENVRAGDDPQSVLGSSLVLLVTGSSLAGDVDALERRAHANAVGGIPMSVVSLAGQENLTHIDRLVAAGQGNRRILASGGEAEALIDRELHSASRAVARALRLRVRLAPGVKLVSVLNSHRLGEPQAEQVREAEVAIDQRLARNMGIEADRGEDEQGIQMVIPNFFTGDSHAILLDVVAEQPGPVADVTVRYKDVINLDNGVAQASLALDDTPREAGALERNVLKNLVAIEVAKQTRLAGEELIAGHASPAWTRLNQLKSLIDGLRKVVPGWQQDLELNADMQVLDTYLSAIRLPPARYPAQRILLADSLQVAAHRRQQPETAR